MRLFDSHCHLDFPALIEDWDGVMTRLCDAGVCGVVVPGVDELQWSRPLKRVPDSVAVRRTFGVHPYALRTHDTESIDEQ